LAPTSHSLSLLSISFTSPQWGVNDKGQCGTGDCMNRDSPGPTKDAFGGTCQTSPSAPIFLSPGVGSRPSQRSLSLPLAGPVVQIACGGQHSACLNPSGQLFTFGSGEFGQVFVQPPCTTRAQTALVCRPPRQLTSASCAWGMVCSQLGLGDLQHHSYPRQISSVTQPIKAVSCGNRHTTFVTGTSRTMR
jgi:hypothetical protein